MSFEMGALGSPALPEAARQIVFRSAGRRHGPITRLVSPSDVGEMIKPFVFLDHAEVRVHGRAARRYSSALGHRNADRQSCRADWPTRTRPASKAR